MKYFLILLFLINIIGCVEENSITGNYKCTTEQMNKVERETLFCNNNGGYEKN